MNRDVMRAREITADAARRDLQRLCDDRSLSETELRELADRIEFAIQLLERIPADATD